MMVVRIGIELDRRPANGGRLLYVPLDAVYTVIPAARVLERSRFLPTEMKLELSRYRLRGGPSRRFSSLPAVPIIGLAATMPVEESEQMDVTDPTLYLVLSVPARIRSRTSVLLSRRAPSKSRLTAP